MVELGESRPWLFVSFAFILSVFFSASLCYYVAWFFDVRSRSTCSLLTFDPFWPSILLIPCDPHHFTNADHVMGINWYQKDCASGSESHLVQIDPMGRGVSGFGLNVKGSSDVVPSLYMYLCLFISMSLPIFLSLSQCLFLYLALFWCGLFSKCTFFYQLQNYKFKDFHFEVPTIHCLKW